MPVNNLSVFLNDDFVGVLTQLPDGRTFLAFGESYSIDSSRPILSLSYKTVLNDLQKNVRPPSVGLPPFFSNLLPEGKLRKYLAEKAHVKEAQDFRLLEALKDDLPGAVVLKADPVPDGATTKELAAEQQAILNSIEGPLRFSLAGVQMKLSGDLRESKIVIPARGVGGNWIVKLPSPGYEFINELEYSMLLLAARIGIAVPEFKLIPTAYLENLPHDLPESMEGHCLISRRFDRTTGGARIHTEDFAQVFNVTDKYNRDFNYQSIANVLWIEIGLEAVQEFVKRLVHMILTGNADMHLKNWSLIYPDGRHPRLSPAYDFVSTVVYPGIEYSLPHKLAGIRDFRKINTETFKTFAQIAKLPERAILNTVSESIDLIMEHWNLLRGELPMPDSYYRLIGEHMATLPLLKERPRVISPISPVPLATTWTGSFFSYDIELDETLLAGRILYKNQAQKQIEMDAPRRMAKSLVEKQLHQVVLADPDFANQKIEGRVGVSLYDEWRKDTFIRIHSRRVDGGLSESQLRQAELRFRATFFPINWRKLESHYRVNEQTLKIDFVLQNGELWTADCTLVSLEKIDLLPAGTLAEICLYIQNAKRLLTLTNNCRSPFVST